MTVNKKATELILNYFPMLSDMMIDDDQTTTKKDLSETESVFHQMALFFQNPKEHTFDIGLVYSHLQGDWVSFAFECLETFFKDDTFLLPKDYSMTINDHDPLLNQSSFAKRLNESGLKFDRKKLSVYYERGKLPKNDALIEGKPYWLTSTVREYISKKE